jgi:vitamin B12 transporter
MFESRDEGRRWNRAYYAQAVGTARSRFSYSAGLRIEDDQRFGKYTTYRLGTAARVAPATRIRAAVGKGFKRPLLYETTGGGFAAPNPGLQPERSTSWEAGIEQTFLGDRLELGGTYFDQHFRDLIQYTPAPSPGGLARYDNLAAVRASGAEAELRLRPTSVIRLDLAYTYLHTEVEDAGADLSGATYAPGKRLLRRPTHTGSAALSWRVIPALALHGNVVLVGDRDDRHFAGFTSTRVTLPSYTKVDLAGEYALPRLAPRAPDLALTLRVDNVLDRQYESIAGFRSPGRLVKVGGRLGVDF